MYASHLLDIARRHPGTTPPKVNAVAEHSRPVHDETPCLILKDLTRDMILGADWLHHHAQIDFITQTVRFKHLGQDTVFPFPHSRGLRNYNSVL